MNDEQMQFFYEIFDASMPRLGPGDDASTVWALGTVLSALRPRTAGQAPMALRTLDLGCGTGAQTLQLAKHLDGTILAVDNYQPYLDELQRRTQAEGVSSRIKTWLKDMGALGLEDGSFDVIWSEGALYCMGFQEGLAACRRLLAPGGCLAVTELCWLRPQPPAECHDFFTAGYPSMADVQTNLAAMGACGFTILDHFILPERAWWDLYYRPLEPRLQGLRERYAQDPGKLEVIELIQKEIDIYRKYSDYYGYVFYVMQRSEGN
jgi:SAM-dependent methyltransferase